MWKNVFGKWLTKYRLVKPVDWCYIRYKRYNYLTASRIAVQQSMKIHYRGKYELPDFLERKWDQKDDINMTKDIWEAEDKDEEAKHWHGFYLNISTISMRLVRNSPIPFPPEMFKE